MLSTPRSKREDLVHGISGACGPICRVGAGHHAGEPDRAAVRRRRFLVIALFGWIIESVFGKKVTPFGRGIVGFLVSALVIWLAQFVVGGVRTSILGAMLAALVIGIVDLFIPAANPYKAGRSHS